MFDWNDLRHLLAVARHGSTLAAAKALQVNQSTVQRRLVALERVLDCSLVERHPTGYRLTEIGQQLRARAERVEQEAIAIALEVLREYPARFERYWIAGMRKKLGLQTEEANDLELIRSLLEWMEQSQSDFTNTFRDLSMEQRMTICNMTIEWGARAGMIAPDETTFAYLEGRAYAPKGADWERAVADWRSLASESCLSSCSPAPWYFCGAIESAGLWPGWPRHSASPPFRRCWHTRGS